MEAQEIHRGPSSSPLALTMAARLRSERQSRGWTQREMARKTGVSTAQITAWELGTRRITLEALEKLAAAFECEAWVLLKPVGPCRNCGGQPVPGFTCNTCRSGS